MLLRGARLQPNGHPLWEVDWASGTKADRASLAQFAQIVQALFDREVTAKGKAVCNVAASTAEQALWRRELTKHAQPTPPDGCAHRLMRRSLIVPPPPVVEPSVDELLTKLPGRKVCAACGGAATRTCAGCVGAHYCDSTCAKRHWPTHKAHCRGESAPEPGRSVLVPSMNPKRDMYVSTVNLRQGLGIRRARRCPARARRSARLERHAAPPPSARAVPWCLRARSPSTRTARRASSSRCRSPLTTR